MSRVKSKNTKPEMLVRSFLPANGFRYRLHDKRLPGSPDIVLKKYGVVIFVNGCFWHGHKACKDGTRLPETRREWWKAKIDRNKKRDLRKIADLLSLGWQVITVWGCELKPKKREATLVQLAETLRNVLKKRGASLD